MGLLAASDEGSCYPLSCWWLFVGYSMCKLDKKLRRHVIRESASGHVLANQCNTSLAFALLGLDARIAGEDYSTIIILQEGEL